MAQKKAIRKQEEAVRAEMARRAQGIGAARERFGDISQFGQAFNGGQGFAAAQNPSNFQNIGKTVQNRSVIEGQIGNQQGAVRDAGRASLTGTAQRGAAALRQTSASRGLMGGSLDADARKALLGQYAGGRSDLAGAVDTTRQDAWGAIRGQQMGYEQAAGGGNVNPQLGAIATAGSAAGARAQLPVVAMGNALNLGLGIVRQGALAEAQGGQGIRALGLPGMGLAPTTGQRARQ